MYCFSCGTAVTPGLSYCNRCGAEVGPKERSANKLSELSPGLLVCAIVVVTIGGLGAIITLLMVLKELATKELSAARERLLPEPLPSITEHTTRALEPMSNQGKAE